MEWNQVAIRCANELSGDELREAITVNLVGAIMVIRQCTNRREDHDLPITKLVPTGGLTVSVAIDDPDRLLDPNHRLRGVRVRIGWDVPTLRRTLENQSNYVNAVLRLRDALREIALLRRGGTASLMETRERQHA